MDKLWTFLNAVYPVVLGVGTSYGTQLVKKIVGLSAKYPKLQGFVLTNKKALLVSVVFTAFVSLLLPGSFIIDFCLVFAVATLSYHLFVKETLTAP